MQQSSGGAFAHTKRILLKPRQNQEQAQNVEKYASALIAMTMQMKKCCELTLNLSGLLPILLPRNRRDRRRLVCVCVCLSVVYCVIYCTPVVLSLCSALACVKIVTAIHLLFHTQLRECGFDFICSFSY